MTKYLLVAEADQIQDLIFRSSKLREVIGGSQLLTRFGDKDDKDSALSLLLAEYPLSSYEIIRAGGGSFRILFQKLTEQELTEMEVKEFGEKLAELYRLATGGTLSVSSPVVVDGDYSKVCEDAEKGLRLAKRSGGNGRATGHLPYISFCSSCGAALANQRYERNNKKVSICVTCRVKNIERSNEVDNFLHPFLEKVVKDVKDVKVVSLDDYNWPGKKEARNDPSADIARFDPRNYIAYLVADGNNMGKLFGKCGSWENESKLSQSLTDILRDCLAAPASILLEKQHEQPEFKEKEKFIPALPLILGGDDIFALIPASYALDYARIFCKEYEKKMKKKLKALRIALDDIPPPTMAAVVVICKVSYPYYLAHQAGEQLLQKAKRLAIKKNIHSSVVDFEVIVGSQLMSQDNKKSRHYYSTMRPYWINDNVPTDWGISLDTLLEQRKKLAELPRRRRSQLKYFFDELNGGLKEEDAKEKEPYLDAILNRIEKRSEEQHTAVKDILGILGDKNNKEEGLFFRSMDTTNEEWMGHALPDLLNVWDFSHKVDEQRLDEEDN